MKGKIKNRCYDRGCNCVTLYFLKVQNSLMGCEFGKTCYNCCYHERDRRDNVYDKVQPEHQFDICLDKFDCYWCDKSVLPPKDSELNVSESQYQPNLYALHFISTFILLDQQWTLTL